MAVLFHLHLKPVILQIPVSYRLKPEFSIDGLEWIFESINESIFEKCSIPAPDIK